MYECKKCVDHGLDEGFCQGYHPTDFLAGKRSSRIWVVGLNPRRTKGDGEPDSVEELEAFFEGRNWRSSAYFRRFMSVSRLFEDFGAERGVATTDIVKCASKSFPPQGANTRAAKNAVIENCKDYLVEQLYTFQPRLLLCNGADVADTMEKILQPSAEFDRQRETSYWTTLGDRRTCVVLSGFLGRLDRFALRRLGREIEKCYAAIDWIE
jgi:hypothetical protein